MCPMCVAWTHCCLPFLHRDPAHSALLQEHMVAYKRVHAAVFHRDHLGTGSSKPERPLRLHWCQGCSLTSLAFTGPEYRLYALFDALTDQETATLICQRVAAWVKAQQAQLFVTV